MNPAPLVNPAQAGKNSATHAWQCSLRFAQPVLIQGQQVVIIPDVVGDISVQEQHEFVLLQAPSHRCAALYLREVELEHIRQQWPKLPVYGLWQLLLASDLIDFSQALQIVPTQAQSGFYLYGQTERLLYSGRYHAGFFPGQSEFSIAHAQVLDFKLQQLQLPQQRARLAKELQLNRRLTQRRAIARVLATGGTLLALAAISDYVLGLTLAQPMAELAAKTHEINTLEQQLHHMAQTYLPARPDQTRQLNALAFIVNQFKQVQTPTPLDLRAQTLSFEVHTSLNPIHLLVDYPELALTSTRLDEAHWRIELEL